MEATEEAAVVWTRVILEKRGPQEWNVLSEDGEIIAEKTSWNKASKTKTNPKRGVKFLLLEGKVRMPTEQDVQQAVRLAREWKANEERSTDVPVLDKQKAHRCVHMSCVQRAELDVSGAHIVNTRRMEAEFHQNRQARVMRARAAKTDEKAAGRITVGSVVQVP